jgi:hypothetical protein
MHSARAKIIYTCPEAGEDMAGAYRFLATPPTPTAFLGVAEPTVRTNWHRRTAAIAKVVGCTSANASAVSRSI